MKVSRLIEKLHQCDQQLDVVMHIGNLDYERTAENSVEYINNINGEYIELSGDEWTILNIKI